MSILNKSSLCPQCASASIRRSRKSGILEQVLHSVLFISPYRCNACDKRYYRLRLPVHSAEKPSRHAS
jgi:transposase-like protein